ncbi:HEAT repeat domain-containing protein [Streptomyces sp. NPDC007088]|uniref:HEAT repeat domain-containing protein n=1 Tax=Streptomyces sp. NPDC007088 TaxID=3364773 RepID=UPI003686A8E5
MTMPKEDTNTARVRRGLENPNASVRLRAALAAGTPPDPRLIDALVERCGTEPDFSVREMLTWALVRHPASATVPRLVEELRSPLPQARGQALHTLSKTGDRRAWPAITRELLADADEEVARSAWRAAVVLVPEAEKTVLGEALVTQLGRGERETQSSLSRALIALGEASTPLLRAAMTDDAGPDVRRHAITTERLRRDPDAGFARAIEEAKRVVALGDYGKVAPGTYGKKG